MFEVVVKGFPVLKNPEQDLFTAEFYSYFKENIYKYLSNHPEIKLISKR